MSNILIVYGSTTGNTFEVAKALGRQFTEAGHEAQVVDAADVSAEGLCEGHDAVLFGCSAWGIDEVELQEDFEPLFAAFDQIGARGCKTAVFATGDSAYEHFCGAVTVIQSRLLDLGAVLMTDGLKLDGGLDSNRAEVEDWGREILEQV